MKWYLRKVDTSTPGNRYDVTPLFADPRALREMASDLVQPFRSRPPDVVACIDALGFILGTAIANQLEVGLIPIRKGGKLPSNTVGTEFKDYSGEVKRLEIRRGAIEVGTKVLVVDDWIETGSQIRAAVELVESQGGVVVGVAAIHMDSTEATAVFRRRYAVHTIWPAEQPVAAGGHA